MAPCFQAAAATARRVALPPISCRPRLRPPAAPQDCELTVGKETRSFDKCFDIADGGFTERVYFTASASPDGGTLFKGGLKAKTPKAGYAGWGLPTRRAKMIGSRSVIVWPDEAAPGGATVDGFIFSSENAAQVGTLALPVPARVAALPLRAVSHAAPAGQRYQPAARLPPYPTPPSLPAPTYPRSCPRTEAPSSSATRRPRTPPVSPPARCPRTCPAAQGPTWPPLRTGGDN